MSAKIDSLWNCVEREALARHLDRAVVWAVAAKAIRTGALPFAAYERGLSNPLPMGSPPAALDLSDEAGREKWAEAIAHDLFYVENTGEIASHFPRRYRVVYIDVRSFTQSIESAYPKKRRRKFHQPMLEAARALIAGGSWPAHREQQHVAVLKWCVSKGYLEQRAVDEYLKDGKALPRGWSHSRFCAVMAENDL